MKDYDIVIGEDELPIPLAYGNVVSDYLSVDDSGEITKEARDMVSALLRRSFRPEFLNRLDEIVFYKPLTKENIRGIIELLIKDLDRRLREKQLQITLTDSAKEYVIDNGYDAVYGARPLKRFMQSAVETLVAREIIAGDPEPDTTITVDYDGERLFIVK